MTIYWNIRYLDRADRQFKDRNLVLDTTTLPPAERAAVELAIETDSNWQFLKFRSLFQEHNPDEGGLRWSAQSIKGVCLPDYHEDEAGVPLSSKDLAEILTGSPTAILVPPGAERHDIDHMLSEDRSPLPVDGITLTQEDIRLLGYFSRDLRELAASACLKDSPGTLEGSVSLTAPEPQLKTAATDDELRSFITIFRRLYMKKEPANFLKAVEVFEKAVGNHRLGKWVVGAAGSYMTHLENKLSNWPMTTPSGGYTFTSKRLIDVFIYTKYAHQPNPDRERQFGECLAEVGGKKSILTWLFLGELYTTSRRIISAGKIIAGWFAQYCEHHKTAPAILESILNDHPGIGSQEKKADKKARIFSAKAEELANAMWQEKGCPSGGPAQFLDAAQRDLRAAPGEDDPPASE